MELKSQLKTIKKGDLFKLLDYFSNDDIKNHSNPAIIVFFHENNEIFQTKFNEINKEFKQLSEEQKMELKTYNTKSFEIIKKYVKFDSKGQPISNNGTFILKNQNDDKIFKQQIEVLKIEYKDLLSIVKEYQDFENKILNENTTIKLNVLPFNELPNINIPFYIIKTISDYKPINL